ncbi:hypothetical protein O3P69_013094 [Scylla paramamosain]|uniref:Uncharacterized protein n=1 Tax=Scylla paramamosain TaxID=85552 RepID=A0AAW0SI71_SCYPA
MSGVREPGCGGGGGGGGGWRCNKWRARRLTLPGCRGMLGSVAGCGGNKACTDKSRNEAQGRGWRGNPRHLPPPLSQHSTGAPPRHAKLGP